MRYCVSIYGHLVAGWRYLIFRWLQFLQVSVPKFDHNLFFARLQETQLQKMRLFWHSYQTPAFTFKSKSSLFEQPIYTAHTALTWECEVTFHARLLCHEMLSTSGFSIQLRSLKQARPIELCHVDVPYCHREHNDEQMPLQVINLPTCHHDEDHRLSDFILRVENNTTSLYRGEP